MSGKRFEGRKHKDAVIWINERSALLRACEAMREALRELVTGCPCAQYVGDQDRECLDCKAGRAALILADEVLGDK